MIRTLTFTFILFFSILTEVSAQDKTQVFQNYLCRAWRLSILSVNGKDTSISEKQQKSYAVFKKDHTFETTTDEETQLKTWQYNPKKETISLKDSKSGYVLRLKIIEQRDNILVLSFVDKKKIIRMQLVPATFEK